MIKVILMTEAGREVDLLPEHMPLREVLDRFHVNYEAGPVVLNNMLLTKTELDSTLKEYAKDSEVRFVIAGVSLEMMAESSEEEPSALDDAEKKGQPSLEKVRELLTEALSILGTVQNTSEEDAPF